MPTLRAIIRAAVLPARRPAAVAALALLAMAVTTMPAVGVEAQGIRLDPVEPSVLGAGSVLRPAVPPGGAATYDLSLRNQRDMPVEVLVYGADATEDGEVASGADNRAVGTWITSAEPRVTLEPGATTTVAVTVARPAGDTEGGIGAIVTQLSEQSRQDLGLDVIRRAALRIEVAADGSGDGVHVEVAGTDPRGGLVPDALAVEVRFGDPNPQAPEPFEALAFDGTVVLSRLFAEDPVYDVAGGEVPAGGDVTTTVEIALPWYGVVGHVTAEAATVGLTTTSAPVRVVVVPPWLGLLLFVLAVLAVLAVLRARRDTPFELGRVPDREASERAGADAEDADAGDAHAGDAHAGDAEDADAGDAHAGDAEDADAEGADADDIDG